MGQVSFSIVLFVGCLLGSHLSLASLVSHHEKFTHDGLQVQLKVTRDSNDRNRKLPVVFLFGGFQNAGRVLELVSSPKPVILVSFDYPYDAPRRFEFPGSLKELPRAKKMIYDTKDGISSIITELSKRKDVDLSKISIIGASLGAPFTIMTAAKDKRISAVMILHGFGMIPKTIEHQFKRTWEGKWYGTGLAWILSRLAWWYTGLSPIENYASSFRESQKVLLIHAESDEFLPQGASQSLTEAFQASKASVTVQVMKGGHLYPGADQMIQEMLGRVVKWMIKYNLW